MNAGEEPITESALRLNGRAKRHGGQRQAVDMTSLEPHGVFLCRQHHAGPSRARGVGDAIDVEVGEGMMVAEHDGARHLPSGGRDVSDKSLWTRHSGHRENDASGRNG
jgi:hypothetical protein